MLCHGPLVGTVKVMTLDDLALCFNQFKDDINQNVLNYLCLILLPRLRWHSLYYNEKH